MKRIKSSWPNGIRLYRKIKAVTYVMQRLLLVTLLIAPGCFIKNTSANTTGQYSMDLNISGEITAITASGSCTILYGKPLEVNFGYVDVEKVNGDNFGRAVYEGNGVECNGTYEGGTPVTVTISGTATSFDNAAIQTSLPGMGLHISAEGKPMTLGVPRSTILSRLNNPFYFRVIAVPVKDPAKTLVANVGFFIANGTMVVNYQ